MERTAYRACFLDYGNTLIEFDRPQIASIVRGFAAELGRRFGPVTEEGLLAAMDRLYELPRLGPEPTYRELPPCEQMAILLRDLYGADSFSAEAVAAADRALQDLFVETVAIAPAEREVLRRLSRTLPLVMVSNYPCGRAIRATLEKLGIEGFFQKVVVSGEVGWVKPHPRIFEEALAGLPLRPEEVLFVGDRWEADLCGARDSGLHTCHMIGFTSETGFEERYRIYRPHHIARSLGEVERILAGL